MTPGVRQPRRREILVRAQIEQIEFARSRLRC